MIRSKRLLGWTLAMGLALVGCQQKNQSETQTTVTESTLGEPVSEVLLLEEPADAQPVIEVRKNAENDKRVTIVGRIGGSENPWVLNRAAFSIVDGTLQACSDIPGDQCPTPWDYCCATD